MDLFVLSHWGFKEVCRGNNKYCTNLFYYMLWPTATYINTKRSLLLTKEQLRQSNQCIAVYYWTKAFPKNRRNKTDTTRYPVELYSNHLYFLKNYSKFINNDIKKVINGYQIPITPRTKYHLSLITLRNTPRHGCLNDVLRSCVANADFWALFFQVMDCPCFLL